MGSESIKQVFVCLLLVGVYYYYLFNFVLKQFWGGVWLFEYGFFVCFLFI